ncbi:MAG TPA: M13 family metallopeptidase, partial [Methanocorpusculum sp.]|nr:M13 family metallopeptidase [Methanocorpusculum sp.]
DLIRVANTMVRDTATRDALGVTPVLPAVEEIRKVSTLDELSALISSGGMSSLKEAFVREAPTGSLKDGSVTILEIVPHEFVLTDPGLYTDMTEENVWLYSYLLGNFQKFLMKCGYSADEANATVVALKKWESELAPSCYSTNAETTMPDYYEKIENMYTYDQLSQMAFPIAGDLKIYHDAGVTRFSIDQPAWLNKLNELYTPENIEGFKAAMLYNLFMTATPFLDTETQNMYFDNAVLILYPNLELLGEEIGDMVMDALPSLISLAENVSAMNSTVSIPIDPAMMQNLSSSLSMESMLPMLTGYFADTRITSEYLGMALGKVITDTYVPAGDKENYTALTREILDVYKQRLMNADWLSESTRAAALDKLSKIKVRILYPDDWSYYSYDDVDYKNAGTLYNLSVQLRKHNQAEIVDDALQAPSERIWIKDPMHQVFIIPQVYNAFYNPRDNSINLLYGYASTLIENRSSTYEDIMAVAGTTIAHEITHGFDPTGSKFDGDGTYVNWWADSDRQNFKEKEQKIADYFSSFEARPGEYLNGSIMTGEVIADLGGLSVVLDIARTKENFDYARFFTAYAQNMYMPQMNSLYSTLLNDVHPPGMYRVNVNVQQYDEFLDTFNVTEGDQMYLAPENRLTIW